MTPIKAYRAGFNKSSTSFPSQICASPSNQGPQTAATRSPPLHLPHCTNTWFQPKSRSRRYPAPTAVAYTCAVPLLFVYAFHHSITPSPPYHNRPPWFRYTPRFRHQICPKRQTMLPSLDTDWVFGLYTKRRADSDVIACILGRKAAKSRARA